MSVCGAPALPVVVDATAEPDPYPRRRDTVATFLAARSKVLGDLYRYASALLEDRRPEGWQHLAAHVGRELMNSWPTTLPRCRWTTRTRLPPNRARSKSLGA